jgi:hypothetical protein
MSSQRTVIHTYRHSSRIEVVKDISATQTPHELGRTRAPARGGNLGSEISSEASEAPERIISRLQLIASQLVSEMFGLSQIAKSHILEVAFRLGHAIFFTILRQ